MDPQNIEATEGGALTSNSPEDQAAQVRSECWGASIPVDVEAIASKVGAVLVYDHMESSLSASLVKEGDRDAVIAVNTSHATTRQRFSIAHELGHLFLHAQAGDHVFVDRPFRALRSDLSSAGTDSREREANAFAAALLMPRDAVFMHAQQLARQGLDDTVDLARGLAKRFQVSEQAMTFRLINLGLIEPQ